ncbi:MAG: hypothetical protein JSW72_01725 [Candidatus Bathyarchaeota archaeon]|nr:MAG: hypothetical protein JSW72_01725 [Candidatus Bathyarchaeota archaeon]
MPFSKKFTKIMGFPKEGDTVNQFVVESLSVDHIYIQKSKPRRYEYSVKMVVRGKGNMADVAAAFDPLLHQKNVRTTSGYGNPYSCSIGQMNISRADEEKYVIDAKGRCTRASHEAHEEYEATQLRKLEEVTLKVYEALFQDQDAVEVDGVIHRLSETSASKIRFVKIEGYTFIEQNPRKDSKWGKLAQEGHKIMWVCRGRAYLYFVKDGQFSKLRRRTRTKKKQTHARAPSRKRALHDAPLQ